MSTDLQSAINVLTEGDADLAALFLTGTASGRQLVEATELVLFGTNPSIGGFAASTAGSMVRA